MINNEKFQTILFWYKKSFRKHWEVNDEGYKWRAVKCFQDNWNIDADDFADMFERATEKADNLLTSARTFPRGMISEFAKADMEATRSMFRTLFDESKDLAFRVDAFRKSSDEIQSKYGNGRWKNHYQNTNAISTYLWLKFPDKYYIYKFGVNKSAAEQLGSDYKPKADGSVSCMIGGYRMYDEVCTELQKDEDLKQKLHDVLTPECCPDPQLKTLTVDFGHYIEAYYPHEYNADLTTQIIQNSDNLSGWEPSLDEYTPGFTVDQWLELLNDTDLIYDTDFIGEIWGGVLAMFYTEKEGVSCKKIGQKFNLSSSQVIARCNQLAQHIYAKKKCPLYQNKYWPILFVGRNAKPGETGTYLWKLRPELYEALTRFDILRYLPKVPDTWEKPMTIDDTLFSRNMILYGPPGTGKTYNTVNYAVAICEGKKPADVQTEDYDEVLYRFNTLKNEGRIAFTTFHQSYGYEEFIEGIRPVTNKEDASKLDYIIKDGIFKSFCERAIEESIQPYNTDPENETPRIWGMILGGNENPGIKNQCFENNEIRLGFSEYKDENITDDNEPQDGITWQAKHMINDFRFEMQPGDYVVIERDQKHIGAIGIITGDYEYEPSRPYPRKRTVQWLVKNIDEEIIPYLPEGRKKLSRFSLWDFDYLGMDSISLILQRNNGAAGSSKPFVFIIDEINRGNISKIFGELITLIEGTKREGADEAMDVILPYSGKRFSVPDNVYILGTMNTADRSIALLDTALRRRFDFVEMMPDSRFLEGVTVEDNGHTADIQKMFEKINERIMYLYDREHMIGHAYFKKVKEKQTLENLKDVFMNRIIPLLQEYFYDDYEKMQLVFGDNDESVDDEHRFILEEEKKSGDLFRGKTDAYDYETKKMFRINEAAFSNIGSYIKIYE